KVELVFQPAIWRSKSLAVSRSSNDIPPYTAAIQKCLNRNPFTRRHSMNEGEVLRKRIVFHLEKEMDESTTENPCEISLKKSNLQCITSVEVDQPLYHEDLRLAVIQRRSFKKNWDGCYV
ncbi:hypothetical protein PFISCL1PPCAC_16128, partial [Pristionchus fissidentatus]